MERKYNIIMSVPLGNRYGTLAFTENDGNIIGILTILENQDTFMGTIGSDGALEFSGKIESLLRVIAYNAKGKITGSKIELHLSGTKDNFFITGEEIKS